jgi:hypothetical protein
MSAPDIDTYPLWYLERGLITFGEYHQQRGYRKPPEPVSDEDRERYAERHAAKHHRVRCAKHGEVRITNSGGYTGFAGGACYFDELSCGCYDVDESDDVRAAR